MCNNYCLETYLYVSGDIVGLKCALILNDKSVLRKIEHR